MSPVRLDLTARLCDAFGLFDAPGVQRRRTRRSRPTSCSRRSTARTTSPRSRPRRWTPSGRTAHTGWAPRTTRPSSGCTRRARGSWPAPATSARPCGPAQAEHGVNFCGGLHHAMPGAASGFCIYNDVAVGDPVAARPRRRAGRLRRRRRPPRRRRRARSSGTTTAGPHGVDPRVRAGAVPRHRLARPTSAAPTPQGSATNVALPPGVADAGWLRAFHSTALPVVRAFRPAGAGHPARLRHPPAGPAGPPRADRGRQREAADALHRLSHEVCDGRWVALGGGGYEIVDVVPRAWTHLTAIAAHAPIPRDGAGARGLARARRELTGRPGAVPDGRPGRRRGPALVAVLGPGVRPRGRGRPRHHGDARRPCSRCTASTSTSTDGPRRRRSHTGVSA